MRTNFGTLRRNMEREESDWYIEAWEALRRSNERLRELERLEAATLERTRNWREELGLTGSK